jgi:DNA-binding CsgD family transcriptional regulator
VSDVFGEQAPITPNEREFILYLARGYRSVEIAPMMGVTVGTVRGYATSLRKKTGVKKAEQLPGAYMALTGEDPLEAEPWS